MPAQRYQKRPCPVQHRSQRRRHLLIHSFVIVTSTITCAVGSLTMTAERSGGNEFQLRAVRVLDTTALNLIATDLSSMSTLKRGVKLETVPPYPPKWARKAKAA